MCPVDKRDALNQLRDRRRAGHGGLRPALSASTAEPSRMGAFTSDVGSSLFRTRCRQVRTFYTFSEDVKKRVKWNISALPCTCRAENRRVCTNEAELHWGKWVGCHPRGVGRPLGHSVGPRGQGCAVTRGTPPGHPLHRVQVWKITAHTPLSPPYFPPWAPLQPCPRGGTAAESRAASCRETFSRSG